MNEQLPGFVLAELFGKSLVIADPAPAGSMANRPAAPQPLFLGDYGKKIIILVSDEDHLHLGDAELQFVSRILAPCNLNLAHVAVINFHRHKVNFRQLKKEGRLEDNQLFFSNKTDKDIILEDEFNSMLGNKVTHIITNDANTKYYAGRIDEAFLKQNVKDFSRHFYLCGPDPMVQAMQEILSRLGASPDAVVFEK